MKAHERITSRTSVAALFVIILLVGLMVSPSSLHAGANRIFDQSATATGQGSAFTAQADDASAIYYNPAGMTQLRGVQTSFGVLLVGGSTSFENPLGQTAKSSFDGSVAYPPPINLYVTANLKDLGINFLGDLSAGVGVVSPFGTLTRWPTNGPFNSAAVFAAMPLIDIKPTIAYRVNDYLSLGLGADIYTFFDFWGEGHLERQTISPGPFPPAGAQIEINGKDTTVGFNASLLVTPVRNMDGKPLLNVGLIYRSQANTQMDGQFLINGAPVADASQTIDLPEVITGGIAFWPVRDRLQEWKLEVDVDYTGWQSIDKLDIQLSNGTTILSPADWRSAYTFMVGTEYKWLRPSALRDWELAVRAGYWYSETPIPDRTFNPEIPDSDNNSISFGLGALCKGKGRFFGLFQCGRSGDETFRPGAIALDGAFKVLLYEPRTVRGNVNPTVNGSYDTTIYVGAINLRVNF
ncbi:MAG: OmpP1/FadL family transporter [Nitrospiraceae bacterium]